MPADDRMAFVLQLMMVLGITLVAMAICATVVVSMAFRKADLEGARTLIPGQGSGDSGWPFQGVVIQ
jgi:hypothetical protein